ncbi:MFS transporter [Schlesneria paludicola]|uniref:MFS transporter n=1 Tax=Schlesneria paludicola TaxID=360056 RepID=UPI00029A5732|nr:MFS transporter [Schlesneria paludicola]
MWSLKGAKRAIIFAGCLAAAYTQLTTSPATIQYIRALGANEFHIGILGAMPTLMLFMQFVSAVVVNHLAYRRRLWFWAAMTHRLMLLPTALGPWLFPEMSDQFWVWTLLITTAINQGLLHFSSPLWLSWMGDYLPHKGLSSFWGQRQLWTQIAAAGSLCAAAFLVHQSGLPIDISYAVMTCIGTLCGVIDLLLFFKVAEPPVQKAPSPRLMKVLTEPFHSSEFRRYIGFMCFWNFAAMAGAPFISLYLLSEVGMDLFHVLLLWTISWVGGAMFSRTLGRWADAHGSQPVLVMCVALKSSNMLALLLIPPSPSIAFWVLAPCFMLDAALNAGILIANNGFMIKNSPSENRTMYIAATQAVAGVVGGLTSILAGLVMQQLSGTQWNVLGWTLGQFQIMFLASIALRWVALLMTRYVNEPSARHTWDVVQEMARDTLERMEVRRTRVFARVRVITKRRLRTGSVIDGTSQGLGADIPGGHARVPAPKRARRLRPRRSQPM